MSRYRVVIHASGTIIEAENETEAMRIAGDLAMQAVRVEKIDKEDK